MKISIKEEGTLFVLFVSLDEISPITAPLVLLLVLFGKPFMSRDASSLFHNVLTYAGKFIEY